MTEEEILELGFMLEDKGMSHTDIDEYLEHFGVRGMKWGVRRERRQRNRQLNRESRAKDKAKYQKEIDRARSRLDRGVHDRTWRESRALFRSERDQFGSRVARQRRASRWEARQHDIETAGMIRDGREAATALLAGVGGLALTAITQAASAQNN